MDDTDDVFRYVYSSSLDNRVCVKVGNFEGFQHKPCYEKLLGDPMLRFSGLYTEQCAPLMVKLQLYNKGKPCGVAVTTSFKAFTKRWNWNEWVTLPMEMRDIPRTAVLTFTIMDYAGPGRTVNVAGTAISLFGKNGVLRQGVYDLRLWPDVAGDGNVPSTTPGKGKDASKNQMQRLAKLAKRHRNGQMQKVDWLDRLTFREIEVINEKEKRQSDYMYLMVEFPSVFVDEKPCSIVYFEPDGDQKYTFISKPKLVTVPDPEILLDNLVEKKHHLLSRSARSGLSDRDAKPTAGDRDILHTIVYRYPPTYTLSSEEQDLVWKFRFYLSSHKKALTKFLKCINWETAAEVRQALGLLAHWTPMDVEDALELLTPIFSHPAVRKYAITRLKQAPDEDLLLYLLQLVQALKYENFDEIFEIYRKIMPEKEIMKSIDDNPCDSTSESTGSPETFADRSVQSVSTPDLQGQVDDILATAASQEGGQNSSSEISEASNTLMSDTNSSSKCNLASFLIQRACRNATLANYFFWYLTVECEDHNHILRKQDEKVREMYMTVLKTFMRTLSMGSPELRTIHANLKKQQCFIEKLVKLVKMVAKESGNRKKKTEKFQQLLADTDAFKINFASFEARPFPLDPEVFIKGIVFQNVTLFKSALMPAKLTFITTTNEDYVAIFKHGDDLRQDQLILQMITLMDKLLRRENLDLKLTPYRVLATSARHGFMQYIDSITVADVIANEGGIHSHFRKHHPCETGPFGFAPEIMDTYIRSCAGYCVITYLLGVGDRHLDNLLLTTSGKLFHIDFGYILGRDPKPMPPPMKLSREMVEAMGGVNSEYHHEFRKLCYTAFLHLRRHANLMLNLFSLMVDASVPDIALEPDKAVKKVEDNLRLGLNDEEAVQHLQGLLDFSISAVMPALVEQIHKLAQYLRK
uniref:Phosphatidylinositol 3-kinase catalytic subunit type 3 n=1 Tax=Phlebotomus kandelakii TaxID=1109342 RepID=A0A6B2EGU4_9DIPT